jgi:hypothetical protein
MCSCGCKSKKSPQATPASGGEKKSYVCYQCNTFKESPAGAPPPECCGKQMQEMD